LVNSTGDAVRAELVALSRDLVPGVRASGLQLAATVAADLGDELSLALLADPVPFVRWTACEKLFFNWCYRAAGPLAELLVREPNELVRNMAACALGYLGDERNLPHLEAALAVETGADHEGSPVRDVIARSIEAITSGRSPVERPRQAEPGAAPDPAT
jgi:HEAT repeat protein